MGLSIPVEQPHLPNSLLSTSSLWESKARRTSLGGFLDLQRQSKARSLFRLRPRSPSAEGIPCRTLPRCRGCSLRPYPCSQKQHKLQALRPREKIPPASSFQDQSRRCPCLWECLSRSQSFLSQLLLACKGRKGLSCLLS